MSVHVFFLIHWNSANNNNFTKMCTIQAVCYSSLATAHTDGECVCVCILFTNKKKQQTNQIGPYKLNWYWRLRRIQRFGQLVFFSLLFFGLFIRFLLVLCTWCLCMIFECMLGVPCRARTSKQANIIKPNSFQMLRRRRRIFVDRCCLRTFHRSVSFVPFSYMVFHIKVALRYTLGAF